MKPLIGITCNYDTRDAIGRMTHLGAPGQDWNYIALDYARGVERAGGCPLFLPQCEEIGTLLPLLERLDGLLLSGGSDVDPRLYGEENRLCGDVFVQRDRLETELCRWALARDGLPVLGICRGVQLMNVALGGTLCQDIEKERGLSHPSGGERPRNRAVHPVRLRAGSRLFQIYGAEEIWVNSYHHQAVARLGRGLIATAEYDGVVEGAEMEGGRFFVGVQWHPEMMYDSAEQDRLFSAFVAQCVRGAR